MKKFNRAQLIRDLGISEPIYDKAFSGILLADSVSAIVMAKLLEAGIGTRSEARNYVVMFVAEATNVQPYFGHKKFWTFGNGSAQDRRVSRILTKIFGGESEPKPSTSRNKVDPITQKAKAIKKWGLTKSQALRAVELAFAK